MTDVERLNRVFFDKRYAVRVSVLMPLATYFKSRTLREYYALFVWDLGEGLPWKSLRASAFGPQ